MRGVADQVRIHQFMEALARQCNVETRAYLTGGATAVLIGWRESTIDVDLKLIPEDDNLLRSIPQIKEQLRINVELASPADFIPVPAGWEERSLFITRIGRISFFHFDLYAQALAKLERGHRQDVEDVAEMTRRSLVQPAKMIAYFERMEPELYRFPALDATSFRRVVEAFAALT